MPGNVRHLVAIDLGATSGRIVLGRLAEHRLEARLIHRFTHAARLIDGHERWDFPHILGSVREGVSLAAEAAEGPVLSLSATGWAQDFGLLDENGLLIEWPVTYRDRRTEGMPGEFADLIPTAELIRRAGSLAAPMTTLCQLRALARREPHLLAKARRILHVADMVHHDLTGQAATDWTAATAGQLVNLNTGSLDADLLRLLGIPPEVLPPMMPLPGVLAPVDPSRSPHPALAGVPVLVTAGHDTAAATAGLGHVGPGEVFLSCGTWSMIGVPVKDVSLAADVAADNPPLALLGLPYGRWGLFRGVMGLWLLEQCCRSWRGRRISIPDADLGDLAGAAGIRSVIDVEDPGLAQAGDVPRAIQDACRGSAQEVPQSPGEFAKVIFDSLAAYYASAVGDFRALMNVHCRCIRMVGGGSRNAYLCRRTAQAARLPVLAGPAEATAIGNLTIQAETLGLVDLAGPERDRLLSPFAPTRYEAEP